MVNNSNINSDCSEGETNMILRRTMGSIGGLMCIVALIIALVSKFYKDIVQRLIVYTLIAMMTFSLFQLHGDDANVNVYVHLFIDIAYDVNLILTLWSTIVLYLCIVHLKELKNLKKLEPAAIITSFIPFILLVLIPFLSFNACKRKLKVSFPRGGKNELEYIYIISYSIAGLLNFVASILVVTIFIKVRKRSQLLQGQNDNHAESPLLTTNKWKTLSKQLLPLVVYPIVNTIVAVTLFPLSTIIYEKFKYDNPLYILVDTLLASLGLITSATVILHLCILKCKKKRRKKHSLLYPVALVTNRSDIFTSYTIASTNARTEYHYDRKSTITSQM